MAHGVGGRAGHPRRLGQRSSPPDDQPHRGPGLPFRERAAELAVPAVVAADAVGQPRRRDAGRGDRHRRPGRPRRRRLGRSLRRGRPTVHVAFDEATALLVGDALQTLAFELVADAKGLDDSIKVQILRVLSGATGARGMAGGQAIDIHRVAQAMQQPELKEMHSLKTGALICAAAESGALLGLGLQAMQSPLYASIRAFAVDLGLAFQVLDDLLDASASTQVLGKTAGKDAQAEKPTFVKLLGLDQTQDLANRLHRSAFAHIEGLDEKAGALRDLAHALTHRQH